MAKDTLCSVTGCSNKAHAKGLCPNHYKKLKRYGDPTLDSGKRLPEHLRHGCLASGCDRPHYQRGFCRMHYMRQYRGQDLGVRPKRADKRDGENHCGKYRCPAARRLIAAVHYAKNKKDYISRAEAQPVEQKRKARNNWNDKHPEKRHLRAKRRREYLRHSAPPWLTPEQWAKMQEVYKASRDITDATGVKHEVDHIIQLAGDKARGLHVPKNLRVMTRSENNARARRQERSLLDRIAEDMMADLRARGLAQE